MEKQTPILEIDIHLVELRYAHTRVKNAAALAKMQNSIIRYGQIVPALAVQAGERNFILLDGYLRIGALKASGQDCIKLEVVDATEAELLFRLLARSNDRHWEVIEQAAVIQELHTRFGFSFGEIATRLGKDKAFVKRRLDLVTSLPEEIRVAVMTGKVSSWSASHVLVPLSRVNERDAVRLTEKLLIEPLTTRELVRLYEHYIRSNRVVRDRIIGDPAMFARVVQQRDESRNAKQISDGPEGKWLKDLTIVCHILKRLISTAQDVFYPNQDRFHRRQRHIWIQKAEEMIVELKNLSGRDLHGNTGMPADDSGDARQGCELT